MKKLMIVAAAAMGLAAFGDIESTNIVGYQTKEAAKGSFMILGVQFQSVGAATYKVNDLITGMVGVDYDEGNVFWTTAPQIQIPNGAGYLTYYYLNDGWDDAAKTTKPGWCDEIGNLVEGEITPGVAVWLKSVQNATAANIAGEVPSSDTATIDCPATFALRANTYPASIKLNSDAMIAADIAGVDYDEGNDFWTTAPQIQVPHGAGYLTYYYLNDGWDDAAKTTKPGWCDEIGNLVTDEIPAAQGFWTKGVGSAFKLTFAK